MHEKSVLPQNPNDKDETGRTPLHRAAMNGWLEGVRLLLDEGALTNAVDVSGMRHGIWGK